MMLMNAILMNETEYLRHYQCDSPDMLASIVSITFVK